MPDLKMATRKSPLALRQAEHVAGMLREWNPGLEIELVAMRTSGDRLLDAPLAKVGGKGSSSRSWSARCSTGARTSRCIR